jgi:Domain of unknown function (DUF4082)
MTRKFLTPVVLPADPAAPMEAAPKQYVDTKAKILNGTAFPTQATGNTGDYYVTTLDGIMFGPKSATGYGAEQTFRGWSAPDTSVSGEIGHKIKVDVAGRITGIHYARMATSPNTLTFRLWNSLTSTLIAGPVTDTRAGLAGEFDVYFGTPVAVAANAELIASIGDASVPCRTNSPSSWDTYRDIHDLGEFSNATIGQFPGTAASSLHNYPFAPIFEASEWWPSTVRNILGNIEDGNGTFFDLTVGEWGHEAETAWGSGGSLVMPHKSYFDMWGWLNIESSGEFDCAGPAQFSNDVLLGHDPTLPLQAATKQYVDAAVTGGNLNPSLTSLRLSSTVDLSISSTGHAFQVGPDSGANLRIDQNEIQTVNNGASTGMWINYEGGKVSFGTGGLESYGHYRAMVSGQRQAQFRNTGINYYEVDGVTPSTVPFTLNVGLNLPTVTPVTLASQNNALTIGTLAGDSMAFSQNEIGVRSAGSATRLKLQPAGGDVELGSDTVNSGLLLRGPGPANNGIWMYTGNPGAFTGQIYCDWASLPTMIYEAPRDNGIVSLRAGNAVGPSGVIEFLTGGTAKMNLDSVGTLNFLGTAASRFLHFGTVHVWQTALTNGSLSLQAAGTGTIGFTTAGTETLRINANLTGELARFNTGVNGYVAFYEGATRRGYLGHYPAGNMRIWADTGAMTVGCQTAGQVLTFATGNVERGRFDDNGHFCVGQTNATVTAVGNYINVTMGQMVAIQDLLNQPNFISNQIGAANAGGSDVAHFRMANTTRGSITHPSTTTTAYNTSSDYRLKDVLGPVDRPLERLMLLKPCHVRWKENGEEQDTFIAHEVAEVVSVAVTGEKDAVAEVDDEHYYAGEIIPQQLDASKLIPLLTAAVQELAEKVEALSG